MMPYAHHPQRETNNRSRHRRERFWQLHSNGCHSDSRTRQSRGCIYVGTKYRRNLCQQHISYRTASHTCNATHEDRNERVDVISQRLAGPGNGK